MKTYTILRNLYGSLTGTTTSTQLALGDQYINDGIRILLGSHDWYFLYKTATATTVASPQFYSYPGDADKILNVTITVGTMVYSMQEVTSRAQWDLLNTVAITSDVPSYYYIFDGKVGIYPTPASSSNTITFSYKRNLKDLSLADYTTGTILTATSGSKSIVGSGTSWNASMVGEFLRITSTSSANGGDGIWYEIDSVASTTTLTLKRAYGGTSIAAGSAVYTIGEMPALPEDYHIAPAYYAVGQFWQINDRADRANQYQEMFAAMQKQLEKEHTSAGVNVVVGSLDDPSYPFINPNLGRFAS